MADSNRRASTVLLAGCALLCFGLLAVVEVVQHVFGVQPCAWCVLQRLIFLVAGVVCALTAFVGARAPRIAGIVLADLLAVAGFVTALYLQFVASHSESCVATLADKIIMALSLHEIAPWMFMPYAPCNEANPSLMGLPLAVWSAIGFVTLSLGLGMALVATLRERG